MTDSPKQPVRKKRRVWLYTVAVFAVVTAVGVSFLYPYYLQGQVKKEIEKLGGRAVSAPAVELLRSSDMFVRIDAILAEGTEFDDELLERLSVCRNLLTLYLYDSRISDDGLKHLTALSTLETLDLGGTEVSDNGLKHLGALPKLQGLSLEYTNVTKAGVEQLRKALPNCDIQY